MNDNRVDKPGAGKTGYTPDTHPTPSDAPEREPRPNDEPDLDQIPDEPGMTPDHDPN